MGKASREKGSRRERQVVKLFRDLGLPAERVPLSGAAGGDFSGDVTFGWPWQLSDKVTAEVKGRAGAEGWKTVKKWLGDNEALFLVEDNHLPLVVLPWRAFSDLLKSLKGYIDEAEGRHGG